MTYEWKRSATVAAIVAAGFSLGGCMSSPTYGTDKTATEQLVGDVTGILSIAPERKAPIDYKPRPDLVRPAKGEAAALPAPQDSVVASGNPEWPESPEQRRARLRAEATANRDTPGWRPEIENDVSVASTGSSAVDSTSDRFSESGVTPVGKAVDAKTQREQFKKQLADQRQGSSSSRKYLSEPPLAYREPSPNAAANDIGEDEVKKERRLKKAARKKGGGMSMPDLKELWPF